MVIECAELAAVAIARQQTIQHAVALEVHPVHPQCHAGGVYKLHFAWRSSSGLKATVWRGHNLSVMGMACRASARLSASTLCGPILGVND